MKWISLKGEVGPIAPRGNKFTKCRRDKLSPAIYDTTFQWAMKNHTRKVYKERA
ncbi:hypothetical protein ALC53_01973 [Atta colombica]|uniref:Uncharacterized protein n=1 Tax=Atta colombica TaxID=520822 RepID=A0A195BTA2_9HYME|nr:hypothetical protein ALC53_01973 [Atta colombica]